MNVKFFSCIHFETMEKKEIKTFSYRYNLMKNSFSMASNRYIRVLTLCLGKRKNPSSKSSK